MTAYMRSFRARDSSRWDMDEGVQVSGNFLPISSKFSYLPNIKFMGESDNVEEFLEELQDYFCINETNENQKLTIATSLLWGKAQQWYKLIGKPQLGAECTYENFKKLIIKAFPAVKNKAKLEVQLYSEFQKSGENPVDFVLQKLKLIQMLYRQSSDEFSLDIIIPRLQVHLRDWIDLRKPSTVSELFELLNTYINRYDGPQNQYEVRPSHSQRYVRDFEPRKNYENYQYKNRYDTQRSPDKEYERAYYKKQQPREKYTPKYSYKKPLN